MMNLLRSAYFIAANTALLSIAIVAGANGILVWRDASRADTYDTLSEPARRNYAHLSRADVDNLLRTTATLRYRHAPHSGFVEAAVSSRFVNVDDRGIRSNGGAAAALDNAVWFLGGSTTFGFGVADSETIPAHLERRLQIPVINFGVRGHASTTENRRLANLLRAGYRPSRVLFLDGINEACEPDQVEDDLSTLVSQAQDGFLLQWTRPVRQLVKRLQTKLAGPRAIDLPPLTCVQNGRENSLSELHARAMNERRALCNVYEIACVTFVQPFAGVHGRHDDRDFMAGPDARALRSLFAHLESSWRAAGATFVTGALDGLDKHAFIDWEHYSAEASARIADAIAVSLR